MEENNLPNNDQQTQELKRGEIICSYGQCNSGTQGFHTAEQANTGERDSEPQNSGFTPNRKQKGKWKELLSLF